MIFHLGKKSGAKTFKIKVKDEGVEIDGGKAVREADEGEDLAAELKGKRGSGDDELEMEVM